MFADGSTDWLHDVAFLLLRMLLYGNKHIQRRVHKLVVAVGLYGSREWNIRLGQGRAPRTSRWCSRLSNKLQGEKGEIVEFALADGSLYKFQNPSPKAHAAFKAPICKSARAHTQAVVVEEGMPAGIEHVVPVEVENGILNRCW